LILPDRMEDVVKKTICGIVLMLFIFGMFDCSYGYSDIDDKYWGYDAINTLTEKGILSGYPDGTFRPDNNMTRAEFLIILMRVIDPSADVSSDTGYWADGSIKIAKDRNIVIESEYSDFDPDKNITRREICLMIYRSFKELEDVNIDNLNNRKEFSDISANNEEEEKITAILSHIGVLNGYLDGTVKLDKFSSRAETCCFIDNFMKCRCMLLSVINDNELVIYENDIAVVNFSRIPTKLKKWQYSEDMPYVTTKIKNIRLFEFDEPPSEYKSIFEDINNSDNIYLQYRQKFGKGNYVIAVEFETVNNTNEYEIYAGAEFLHISFIEEEISIIDSFDTAEIDKQLNKNADIGQPVRPGESLNTSAFYVVNRLPNRNIRFDRSITDLYDIKKKQNLPVTSFHSLIVNFESR